MIQNKTKEKNSTTDEYICFHKICYKTVRLQ